MAKSETKKMLAAAVAAAEAKQAVDLRVLELDPAESSLTDFFLVMSGTNARQIQTLADEIELRLKREFGEMPNSREGYRQAEWVLLDYVDFVVHIFSEEKRAYYGIERLRKSAISRDPASVRAARVKAAGRKAVGKPASERGSKPASQRVSKPARQGVSKPGAGGTRERAAKRSPGKKVSARAPKTTPKKAASKKAASARRKRG